MNDCTYDSAFGFLSSVGQILEDMVLPKPNDGINDKHKADELVKQYEKRDVISKTAMESLAQTESQ